MPIRAGDLIASTPGTSANLISDGQRLRVKWSKGDGDGNSSLYIIERSIAIKRGHPTWKVYCGDVESDKEDVPKYIYLDDKAAYDIWKSEKWTKQDLKKFWPFDFDAMRRIMGRRVNRGRPAIGEGGEYLTGVLRDKSKVFVFKGGPDHVSAPPVETMAGVGIEGTVPLANTDATHAAIAPPSLSNPIRTPDSKVDSSGGDTSLYPPNPYEPTLTPMDGAITVPEVFRFDIPSTTAKHCADASSGDVFDVAGAKRKTKSVGVKRKMESVGAEVGKRAKKSKK